MGTVSRFSSRGLSWPRLGCCLLWFWGGALATQAGAVAVGDTYGIGASVSGDTRCWQCAHYDGFCPLCDELSLVLLLLLVVVL